ncbi:MAG: LptA/OstA family protein [Desulfatiglandaceae bacterium]
MKYNLAPILLFSVFIMSGGWAFGEEESKPPRENDEPVTVITSEKMVYNSEKQTAVFENNVQVEDDRLSLSSEKLTAEFDENNEVKSLLAEGSVYMEQDDKTAWAESASYNVETGKMVLKGDPLVRQGKDMLQGETITFWRDESRMVCEPDARLTIYSQDSKMREQLNGDN